LALEIEHFACAGQTFSLEPRMVGQIGQRPIIEFDNLLDIDGGTVDGLVLAELPVGDMQICDLDSTDYRVTGGTTGDRLRVVHCGRNQIVKIEGLDVEGAPHLLAARAQQINHVLLIRNWIERCLWFWPGCNLTERQG